MLGILKEAKKNSCKTYVALSPSKRNDNTYMEMLKPYCNAIHIVQPMPWYYLRQTKWYKKIVNYLYNCYLSGWHVVPVVKLYKIIKNNKINIVHTNTAWGIEAMIAAKIAGVPHVWHIREIIGDNPDAIVQFPFQAYPKAVKWVMDKFSMKIITNSKFTASFAKRYFPNNKLVIIYNGLPDNWFVKKSYDKDKPELIIGVVANVVAFKNHNLVIDVANVLRSKYPELNTKFNIYGAIPASDDAYYCRLKNMIKKLELNTIITFCGIESVEKIYNNIDILFHPCNKEGFGRIFIEAMGKGVPVVAVKGGGADELIEHGVTGYKADIDRPEESADNIALLLKNHNIFCKITVKALEFASKFTESVMWKKIDYCYRGIIK